MERVHMTRAEIGTCPPCCVDLKPLPFFVYRPKSRVRLRRGIACVVLPRTPNISTVLIREKIVGETV